MNTANSHEGLKGKTPETFVSSETADISEFANFGWYDWIMFLDTTVSYPGSKPQLGRYYGPAYEIGPAMTAKILKGNGEYAYRLILRGLTDIEKKYPVIERLMVKFNQRVAEKLGKK